MMRQNLDKRIPALVEVQEKVQKMENQVLVRESIADFKKFGSKGATAAILNKDQLKALTDSKNLNLSEV